MQAIIPQSGIPRRKFRDENFVATHGQPCFAGMLPRGGAGCAVPDDAAAQLRLAFGADGAPFPPIVRPLLFMLK